MNATPTPEWIAVDWGTSNVRAFAMQGATVTAQAQSDQGMNALAPDQFEQALETLIAPWDLPRAPVVACGMVGARQGWREAPYLTVPTAPLSHAPVQVNTASGRQVYIVPGLAQRTPADVMRGEETQIAGFLSLNTGWDGVLCLPGTHTKWVHLSAGEVVSFQTFMTGELFALLSTASVLQHSATGTDWDESAFDAAISEALSKPERLAARLFTLRAADLLEGQSHGTTRAALSGYLIGAELAAARAYWLGQNLAILGTGHQARAYQTGLLSQGATSMLVDAERATVAGLTTAYRNLKGPQ